MFLDTLLKGNNGEISVLVYRSLHILTNTYTTALTTKQVARKVLFPPCLIAYSIITNKDDLHKENARIKQVLKENDIEKALLIKSLGELLIITACLSHNN